MIRFLDVLISFLGILVLSPALILISLLISVDSKGSTFYRQIRVGKDSKDFALLKFRTMKTDADKLGLLTIGGRDARITRIGYFLRKYKIDELPQLWNVLLGSMSLVGPRPEVRKYVQYYNTEQQQVLKVKPGITDWASIEYRNENEILSQSANPEKSYIEIVIPEKIRLNMIYIGKQNVSHYLKIIFYTFIKLLK